MLAHCGFEIPTLAISVLEKLLAQNSKEPFDAWYETLRVGERMSFASRPWLRAAASCRSEFPSPARR